MQSNDFVEGVSGWRLTAGKLEIYGGQDPVIIGNLDLPEDANPKPRPFFVVDGVTYLSEAFIKESSIVAQPLSANWSVKVQVTDSGQQVVAGLGEGLPSQFCASADRFAISRLISETKLCEALQAALPTLVEKLKADVEAIQLERVAESGRADADNALLPEKIKDVIRSELLPGGLLHRSR